MFCGKIKALMLRKTRLTQGFTIIELMVTVIVIGVLLTIITFASIKLQEQSRDSEREGDVMAIMAALEKYYDKNGEYPSNDTLNPTQNPSALPDFNAVKALMPELSDAELKGPGDYTFYAGCVNSTTCANSSSTWLSNAKEYIYISRFDTQTSTNPSDTNKAWFNVPATYGNNTGWGCGVTTYYKNPGFVIAWRREQDGVWVFKRSVHGQVEIANYDSGPVAPQTCTFS